ncbi:MAG TPA: carbohydrate binding family 9 domain-containing protein, partial [Ferruginibacter sp.]|nr:carbohydrate binding family 9 domain-containing protein [Ferruginibacter sp.]
MKKYSLLFLLCMICIVPASMAQGSDSIPRKKYTTARLKGVPIVLDGIPSEETWNGVEWGGDFTQWQPAEGKPPSQPTRFKILYDDRFLYIAYDCIDKAADSIDKRMGRRDAFPGDFVEINIDSYHDKRTAFSFTLSVSGVRGDEFVSNDGDNWDENWNPIWYAKTHIHKGGWTAEVKIPLSQLRYGNEKDKVWGIQIMRRIFRKEERSTWQLIPQNSGVWVSRFGELHGLKDIPFHRQVEIAPYVTVQADKYKKEAGNPFADGFDAKLTGGLDGKV